MRSAAALGTVVMLGWSLTSAAEDVVRFKNAADRSMTVLAHVGTGPCGQRIDTQTFTLPAGQTGILGLPGKASTVCYVSSFLTRPDDSPFGGGEARAGETVELRGDAAPLALPLSTPPSAETSSGGRLTLLDSGINASLSRNVNKGVNFEREVASWRDPLTPPQTRTECTNWFITKIPFDGEFKTCSGWQLQCRWMNRQAVLVVNAADGVDVQGAANQCLQTAAVAGAIATIATGGGGIEAAVATFKACMVAKIGSQLLGVRIDNRGGWDADWHGC